MWISGWARERRRRGAQEDLALWCQSRMAEGGIVPPPSVLAPGTALRLLRSRALPSAQAIGIVLAGPCWRIGQNREEMEGTEGRSGCSIRVAWWQLEIPPVWANSREDLDAAVWASKGRGQQHDALGGVA